MDTTLSELEIFTDYYAKLCNTLVDIEYLLPYFVQEGIVNVAKLTEIQAMPTKIEKLNHLLTDIAGPLRVGYTKSFFTLLRIMEDHGTQATRDLAIEMRSVVMINTAGQHCS